MDHPTPCGGCTKTSPASLRVVGQTISAGKSLRKSRSMEITEKYRSHIGGCTALDCSPIQLRSPSSSGVHVVLPSYYSPTNMGLLDPSTSDGRVIFFLPWQGQTIAGTTDKPCAVTHDPAPTEDDIQFILKEIRNYLSPEVHVRRGDVLSAWSGIRPLVLDLTSKVRFAYECTRVKHHRFLAICPNVSCFQERDFVFAAQSWQNRGYRT